jgi:hypothetical protein
VPTRRPARASPLFQSFAAPPPTQPPIKSSCAYDSAEPEHPIEAVAAKSANRMTGSLNVLMTISCVGLVTRGSGSPPPA